MYRGVSQLLQQVSRSREGPLTEVSQMCERPGRLADLLHWPAPGAAWLPPPGCRLVPPGMHEAHQAAPGGKLGGTVVLESAPSL